MKKSSKKKSIKKFPTGGKVKGPVEYLNSYYDSEEFKRRSGENYTTNLEYTKKQRNKYRPIMGSDASHEERYNTGPIYYSQKQADEIGADLKNDVVPHEYSHLTRNLDVSEALNVARLNKNPEAINKLQSLINKRKELNSKYGPYKFDNFYNGYIDSFGIDPHTISPVENYADLNALRWMMYSRGIYDTRKGKLDSETFKKVMNDPAIKDSSILKRMLQNFTPENIVELNNEVAYNNNNDNNMAKSGIHIKPSKRGSLHKALGIPQGKKIPASKLADKPGDSPAMKKKAKKKMPEGGKVKGPIGFLNSYYNSDEFKKRSGGDYEVNKIYSDTGNELYVPKIVNRDFRGSHAAGPEELMSSNKYKRKGIPTVILDKSEANEEKIDLLNEVLPHEYSHTTRLLNNNVEKKFIDANSAITPKTFFEYYNQEKLSGKTDKNFSSWAAPIVPHDQLPNENYADLNTIRWLMYQHGIYDTRKGKLDLPTFQKAMKDPKIGNSYIMKRMLQNFTPENIVKLNNEVAYENNTENDNNMAKSGFKINPKHKGFCTPMTKKTCTGKRRQFAINAKNHFKKGEMGMELDPIEFPQAPSWLQNYNPQESFPGFQDENTLAPVTVTNNKRTLPTSELANVGGSQALTTPNLTNKQLPSTIPIQQPALSERTGNEKFDWGWLNSENLTTGLSLIDKLIPSKKQKTNYLTPANQVWNNQNPYGTGSTALMGYGGNISPDKAKEMLKNPPHGKKLTAKQKKLFQAVAHGWQPKAPDGTTIPSTRNVKFRKELYNPFGTNAQAAFDNGWMPETDPINGVTTYKNRYDRTFNSVYIPGQDQLGNVILTGNQNGTFDANIRDSKGKIVKNLVSGVDYNGINNYLTNYNSTIANRVNNIKKGVNFDNDVQDANLSRQIVARDMNGGKMNNGGNIGNHMYIEDGQYSNISPSFIQFEGPSHANGGIDISYQGNNVEVEGDETAAKTADSGVTVFGNMTVPGTKMKFKTAGKKLAHQENKAIKQKITATNLMEENSPYNKFERLAYNAGMLKELGAKDKIASVIGKKEFLSDLQQTMLEFANENNIDPEAMSDGKRKKAKNGVKMPDGGKLTRSDRNNNPGNIKYGVFAKRLGATGQDSDGFAIFPSREQGSKAMKTLLTGNSYKNLSVNQAINRWTANSPYDLSGLKGLNDKKISSLSPDELNNVLDYMVKGEGTKYGTNNTPPPAQSNEIPLLRPQGDIRTSMPRFNENPFPSPLENIPPSTRTQIPPERNYDFSVPEANPPSNVTPLGFEQYAPELYAFATNRRAFVPAQKFTPRLYEPYQVSFQDRVNENNYAFNAIENTLSDNPAALSSLSAQLYNANNSVRGEEFRTNQQIGNDIINKNISLENQAQLQNLGILDTQYVRQEQARSNTRRDNQLILNSLASKILQHEYENKTLAAYENMSNYRMVDTNNDGIPDRTTYFGPEYTPSYGGSSGVDYNQSNSDSIEYANYPKTSVKRDAYGVPVSYTTSDDYKRKTPTSKGKGKNGINLQKTFNEKFGRK